MSIGLVVEWVGLVGGAIVMVAALWHFRDAGAGWFVAFGFICGLVCAFGNEWRQKKQGNE